MAGADGNSRPTFKFSNLHNVTTATTLKSTFGKLRSITVGTSVAGNVLVQDGANTLSTLTFAAASAPVTILFDVDFLTSLVITPSITGFDVTVSWI